MSAALLLLLAIVVSDMPWLYGAMENVVHGHKISDDEAFEATRRDASIWLGKIALPGSVILTCYGWPAYAALQSTIDDPCHLSTSNKSVGPPNWGIGSNFPGVIRPFMPVTPAGGVLVRDFVSNVGVGGNTWVYDFPR